MLRLTPLLATLVVLAACKDAPTKDSSPSVTVTTASVTTASAAPKTSASAPVIAAKGNACAALEWDKDGMNAKASTFKGKVDDGEGSDANGKMEKFQTLTLEKPACGPDKAPVPELQLYTNAKSIDLKKLVGKTVTIEGEPFASHTAHHHRPIVVEVKKLTPN